MTVALSWGHALQSMVYATTADQEHHRLNLVQLVGGLSSIRNEISGQELVRELAVRLGAGVPLPARPGRRWSPALSRDALMAESVDRRRRSTRPARADLAFVGIGAPTHGSSAAILDSLNLSDEEHAGVLGRRPGRRHRGPLLRRQGPPDPRRRRGPGPRRQPRRPRPRSRTSSASPRAGPRSPASSVPCAGTSSTPSSATRSLARHLLSEPRGPRRSHASRQRRCLTCTTTALVLLGAVVAGWTVQLYFTYRQSMAFNADVRALRSEGTVSVGAGRQALPRRPGLRGHRRRRATGSSRDAICAQRLHHLRPGEGAAAARRPAGQQAARRARHRRTSARPSARRRVRRRRCCARPASEAAPAGTERTPGGARLTELPAGRHGVEPIQDAQGASSGLARQHQPRCRSSITNWPSQDGRLDEEQSCHSPIWSRARVTSPRTTPRSTNRPASSAHWPTPPTGSSDSSRPAARSSWAWSPASSRR